LITPISTKTGARIPSSALCAPARLCNPAHYGVDLRNNTVTLFADIHQVTGEDPKEGTYDFCYDYDKGCDLILDQYQLSASTLRLFPGVSPEPNFATIFFTPVFADISFNSEITPLPTDPFFEIKLSQATSAVTRQKCLHIHKISGIPEIFDCPT